MQRGYIAITSHDWIENIKKQKVNKAVFWRKKSTFKAIEKGDFFYFFSKETTGNIRKIIGRGTLSNVEMLNVKELWEKYGVSTGYECEEMLEKEIETIYGNSDFLLGCIVLENISFFKRRILVNECGITFLPGIVSGKTISQEEVRKIEIIAGGDYDYE